MSMVWKLAPTPRDDELLSSYLVRVAHAHGAGAYRFFSYHLPKTAIWNRDIDRSVSDNTLERIALMSGLTFDRVYEMTLKPYMLRLGLELGSKENKKIPAIFPWLNAIGIYHTTRRRFGLQYCPECLSIDPIFKLQWRSAFVTACPLHHRTLLDTCTSCDSPIVPHRNHVSQLHCHLCHHSLTMGLPHKIHSPSSEELFFLPDLYSNSSSKQISIQANIAELFIGIHKLLSMLRRHGTYCRKNHLLINAGKGPIELLRTKDRAKVVIFLKTLLDGWPNSFRKIAAETGLNKNHTIHTLSPTWVQSEIDLLPPGSIKTRRNNKNSLAEEFKIIKRDKPSGWRTRHAELLLKMSERIS